MMVNVCTALPSSLHMELGQLRCNCDWALLTEHRTELPIAINTARTIQAKKRGCSVLRST